MKTTIAVLGLAGILIAQMGPTEIRVDTFDRKADRTGYLLVDPATGRIDQYDRSSRHTGSATITPRPGVPAQGADSFDANRSRSITIDKRLR